MFKIANNQLTDIYRREGRRPLIEAWGDREIAAVVRDNQKEYRQDLEDCLRQLGGKFIDVVKRYLAEQATEAIA